MGSAEAPKLSPSWDVYRPLLRHPDQQSLMLMQFVVHCNGGAMMAVFPLHAMAVLGSASSTTMVGSLFALTAGFGCFCAPLGGYLADRIGRKQVIVSAGCLAALGASMTSLESVSTFETLLAS